MRILCAWMAESLDRDTLSVAWHCPEGEYIIRHLNDSLRDGWAKVRRDRRLATALRRPEELGDVRLCRSWDGGGLYAVEVAR